MNSDVLSSQDPVAKFGKRVVGIGDAKAPATTSLLRYNERALPVLSCVAQFASPPSSANLRSKEFFALHKLLRFPPCSLPHAFLHSLNLFSIVEPTPIEEYCSAIMYRFALSEAPYLATLASSIKLLIGEHMPISCARNVCIPDGGHNCTPILHALTDALCFQGSHHKLREAFNVCSSHNWIVAPTVSYCFGNRVAYIPSRCPNNVQSCIL